VAQDDVEAVHVILDGGVELDAAELSQAGAAHRWAKLKVAQLLEALPRRLALVLHEGEVPRLSCPTKVIGRQPCVIRQRGLLSTEELLAMVEPVQPIIEAVVRRELQLVEARNGLTGTVRPRKRLEQRPWWRPCRAGTGSCQRPHIDVGRPGSPVRSGGRPGQRGNRRPRRQ
jgi:hypothetical protein